MGLKTPIYLVTALVVAMSGVACAAAKSNDKDKVTVTINAVCQASAVVSVDDSQMKDQLTVTLSERATYRIIGDGGGSLGLELIDQRSSLSASGGGSIHSKEISGSWTYSPKYPHTSDCLGDVYINRNAGEGSISLVNIVTAAGVQSQPVEDMNLAIAIAEGCCASGLSTLPIPTEAAESNASFLKGLNFTFNPKAKDFTAGGQASYKYAMESKEGTIGTATFNVSYQVQSGMPEVVEAVIVPKGDYKSWLPMADGTGPNTPGNTITFDVELRGSKGSKAKDKTAQFEIELTDTSRYPGTCMNSPWDDTQPDLKIIKDNNSKLTEVSGDGQTAKTAKGLKSATITLSCFDGAAIGKLSIRARIDGDDNVIAAHLENEPDLTEISVPYDSDNNSIADAWEKKNDTWGKALNTDEDSEPQGDRHKGDGLTIWEEYRGFQEARKYFRTDPRKKDFFACDNIGGKTQMALDRLKVLTKLEVHGKLRLDELSQSHIINRNWAEEDKHVVEQHGVLINTWGVKGICEAVGGPGPPGKIREVCIDSTLSDTVTRKISPTNTKTFPYYIPTVVHELLHCCNVWHHGQCDVNVYWQASTVAEVTSIYEYAKRADCGHPEKGTKIWAYMEHDVTKVYDATAPFWASPISIWLGKNQGQHSGFEDCVMRYDCSQAAVRSASSRYSYHRMDQESVGQGLCISGTGTGVNAAGRAPTSRYGDADGSYGNCADQICVNDLQH